MSASGAFVNYMHHMCVAVGGLTESVVKESSVQLLRWCHDMNDQKKHNCIYKLLASFSGLFSEYSQTKAGNRVIIPLLKTIELVLRNGVLSPMYDELIAKQQLMVESADEADTGRANVC